MSNRASIVPSHTSTSQLRVPVPAGEAGRTNTEARPGYNIQERSLLPDLHYKRLKV